MRTVYGLGLVALAACGQLVAVDGGNAAPVAITASADGGGVLTGTVVDGGAPLVPGRRCDPGLAFGAPEKLTQTLPHAETLRLSTSGSGVLSVAGTNDDIHRHVAAARVTGNVVTIASLGAAFDDDPFFGQGALSPDGRLLVVVHGKDLASTDLFFARRTSIETTFPAPAQAIHEDIADPLFGPYLAGGHLYLSHVPKHGNETIAVGSFDAATGVLEGVSDLPSIASFPGAKYLPVVSEDELEIFFAESLSTNDAEIVHATRASTSAPFGPPTLVLELIGGRAWDVPSWLSSDGCTLYLVSNRDGDKQVWRATRQ